MLDLFEYLLFPLLVVVIGLLIEYGIIQPMSRKQQIDTSHPNRFVFKKPNSSFFILTGTVAFIVFVIVFFFQTGLSDIFKSPTSSPNPINTPSRTPLLLNSTANGNIVVGETDEFIFQASNLNIITVEVKPIGNLRLDIFLLDSNGMIIEGYLDSSSSDYGIIELAPELNVNYTVRVRGKEPYPIGSYIISVKQNP